MAMGPQSRKITSTHRTHRTHRPRIYKEQPGSVTVTVIVPCPWHGSSLDRLSEHKCFAFELAGRKHSEAFFPCADVCILYGILSKWAAIRPRNLAQCVLSHSSSPRKQPSAAPGGSCGLACASVSRHTFCKAPQLRKINPGLTHRTNRTHGMPYFERHVLVCPASSNAKAAKHFNIVACGPGRRSCLVMLVRK
jgi:hypothetical protein